MNEQQPDPSHRDRSDETKVKEDPDDPNGPPGALKELVRLGERVLDAQLNATNAMDAKWRHLLTLSGGILIAAVAMAGFVSGRSFGSLLGTWDLGRGPFLVLVGVSFSSTFLAFCLFARAYLESKKIGQRIQIGWDTEALWEAAQGDDFLRDVRRATIRAMGKWSSHNQGILSKKSRYGWWGVWFLTVGGATLALALLYVLGAI